GGALPPRFLARPAPGVRARAAAGPARPPHLVGEPAKVAVGVLVEAGLEAEVLGVEPPALDERAHFRGAAEWRYALHLPLERDLEVVSGDGLVESQGLQHVERPALERVGVHPVGAGPSAADRGLHVAAARVF